MHQVLQVDELLTAILSSTDVSSATLCVAARTCRAFHAVALRLIWRSLDGFTPLLNLFPNELVLFHSSGETVRVIQLDDNTILKASAYSDLAVHRALGTGTVFYFIPG